METCRLCDTESYTKYELIELSQFLSNITFLNGIICDGQPQKICKTCFTTAKATEKFLDRIKETQKKFIVSKLTVVSPEDILKKYQGISFKKVKPNICSSNDDLDVPYLKNVHHETIVVEYGDVEIKHEEEYLIEERTEDYLDQDDEPSEDDIEESEDETFIPSTSKTIQVSKTKTTKKKMPGLYLDVPNCYICQKCRKEYPTFKELFTHTKLMECDQTSLTCEVCKKKFASKKALHSHSYIHKIKETFLCEDCGKSFNNQFSLDIHIQTHRRIELDSYIFRCCHCDHKFNNHLDLSDHVKKHQKDKKEMPRLCETCGKNCANLKAYQAHIATHSDKPKKYICDICKKAFRRRIFLIQHSHVHTGIKAFQCNLCDKSFAKSESLVYHIRKHQNITPYDCKSCSESFVSLAKLKTHTSRAHNLDL